MELISVVDPHIPRSLYTTLAWFSSTTHLVSGLQVRSFFTALKALSIKEIHYGSYATPEQVLLSLACKFSVLVYS